jgi:hypothetical protein
MYAVVEQFTLQGSAGAPPPEPPDASAPPPGGGRVPRCPATAPANGASCDPTLGPLECEYGGDADGRCTTLAACALTPPANAFAYVVTQSSDCGGTNDPSCPASLDAAEALPLDPPSDGGLDPRCNPEGGVEPTVTCNYPGAACSCVVPNGATACTCLTGADVASESNGQCPAQRPLAGDGCTVEGVWCGYAPPCGGSVSIGPSMMCVDGHWIQFEELAGCPAVSIVCPAPLGG